VSNPATENQRNAASNHVIIPVDVAKEKQIIGKFEAEEGVKNVFGILPADLANLSTADMTDLNSNLSQVMEMNGIKRGTNNVTE
jgi:2-phospho-L-lactate guanylyltransferase (CobY/MobA/RfbA family)